MSEETEKTIDEICEELSQAADEGQAVWCRRAKLVKAMALASENRGGEMVFRFPTGEQVAVGCRTYQVLEAISLLLGRTLEEESDTETASQVMSLISSLLSDATEEEREADAEEEPENEDGDDSEDGDDGNDDNNPWGYYAGIELLK